MTRLLFVVAEDWYFRSHRLPLARAALAAGYEVGLATRVGAAGAALESEGIRLFPLARLNRGSLNPLREMAAIAELAAVYRRFRPAIVHHVALKPVLYGSLAARAAGVPVVVNALAGLGYMFESSGRRARWLRPAMYGVLRAATHARGGCVIVQNGADAETLVQRRVVSAERLRIVRGSGVDIKTYVPTPEPPGVPLVILPARLLWDKGVGEFVDAAQRLKRRGCKARFALVGAPDNHNPQAIDQATIDGWIAAGAVEWWGRRDDMPAVFARSTLVCLPSYFEGLPKALLEAAACGRAIVASDIPGCREIVRDGITGRCVPVRDAAALADAIEALLADAALRRHLGAGGRRIVENEFTDTAVAAQTLAIYASLTRNLEGRAALRACPPA